MLPTKPLFTSDIFGVIGFLYKKLVINLNFGFIALIIIGDFLEILVLFTEEKGHGALVEVKSARRTRKIPAYQRDKPEVEVNRLLEILGLGGGAEAKSLWGKLSGYSKRATVESAIARWKKLFSGYLESREAKRQQVETRLKSLIINKLNKQELWVK